MKRKEPYILWLPSWYPNRLDPYNGDFIQRHSKAASIYNNIHVIYVVKDIYGYVTKSNKKETYDHGQLKETIIYYYIAPQKFKLLERVISLKKYLFLFSQEIKLAIHNDGKPELLHLYITFKAGILALWVSKKFKIPYVVSEQWTIYLKEAQPNFLNLPFYTRYLIKKIFSKASSVMVVSDYLGKTLQHLFTIQRPILIPNVLDDHIFYYTKHEFHTNNRFVHISNLDYQKNPEDILKAFAIVKQKGYEFSLDIIGRATIGLNQLMIDYKLTNEIHFHKEMPQIELAKFIQGSEALILFSRYETFGCVLIEANACGVPVIVSDIPVLHENVEEFSNGLFATNCDPFDLSEKIIYLINNKKLFDREKISRKTIEKFRYEIAGMQFHTWYNKFIN